MRTDTENEITFIETTGTRAMTFAPGPMHRVIRCWHDGPSGNPMSPPGTIAPRELDRWADDGGAL